MLLDNLASYHVPFIEHISQLLAVVLYTTLITNYYCRQTYRLMRNMLLSYYIIHVIYAITISCIAYRSHCIHVIDNIQQCELSESHVHIHTTLPIHIHSKERNLRVSWSKETSKELVEYRYMAISNRRKCTWAFAREWALSIHPTKITIYRMARNFRGLKFSLFCESIMNLENFTLKINPHVPPPRPATCARTSGATSRSQHFQPFICSCCIKKLWLFFGTSKLWTSLTISYPILVVLSL